MERVVADNGVEYYRSRLIPVVHGFSTRSGGVSKHSHTESLNLGFGRGDSDDIVIKNLVRFADALGIDPEGVISVTQIHSSKIRYVTEKDRGEGFFRTETESCDGYITDSDRLTLGVRTADCVPILFYAPPCDSFRGAVAAVHAGWRGTALGIVREAVHQLINRGADVAELRVAIGPAIGKCCYCVRKDFYDSFCRSAGKVLTNKYVTPVREDIWVADLKGANREILIECGISPENIDVCDLCTCCEPTKFYSHRYSKGVRGTMLSVITMKKQEKR